MVQYYDVALAAAEGYFASRFREYCGQFNLPFFLVEPIWVSEFLRRIEEGEVGVKVLVDMASDAGEDGNPYFALAKAVKAAGGYVINDPDLGALAAHKGRFHPVLEQNGVPVPRSIIVPRDGLASFRVTNELKATLGVPFVVKPGWGGGAVGVNINSRSEQDLLQCAELAPNSDSFLVQERIQPRDLEGHRAWFRVFHILGEAIPCWWEPPANQYQLVTPLQQKVYRLGRLKKIVKDIARVSGVEFFTTEICYTTDRRFLAVDYLNTDCDMHPKSFFPTGVPDEVVRHISLLLTHRALAVCKRGHGYFDEELEEKDLDWGQRRQLGMLVPGE
ncbi:MAG: hypothetical protein FJ316_11440 [SAR202 cluster bacterium]|nr:hypothetical protein [SAR202 cluster bacterium]